MNTTAQAVINGSLVEGLFVTQKKNKKKNTEMSRARCNQWAVAAAN